MRNLKFVLFLTVIIVACSALKPGQSAINTTEEQETNSIEAQVTQVAPIGEVAPDSTKWEAPESASAVKNPIASSEESIGEGMLLYKKNCRSCHGRIGDGKGAGAEDCEVPPANLTSKDVKTQADGALFWKIKEGKNDMDPFKDELEEEEIWKIVNYIRSLTPVE